MRAVPEISRGAGGCICLMRNMNGKTEQRRGKRIEAFRRRLLSERLLLSISPLDLVPCSDF
jgi:hypothetical protein